MWMRKAFFSWCQVAMLPLASEFNQKYHMMLCHQHHNEISQES